MPWCLCFLFLEVGVEGVGVLLMKRCFGVEVELPPLMGGPTLAATAELAFFASFRSMAAPHLLAKRARKKYPKEAVCSCLGKQNLY